MTEITNNRDGRGKGAEAKVTDAQGAHQPLHEMPEALRRFILHWGDMGTTWGVNRTVAQIHALLYVSEDPLNAEQITECLGVARSNVSNSLKELLNIKTIRRVPVVGDRRDYFTAETDVWEIAKRVAAERKAREIDPALEALGLALEAAQRDGDISAEQHRRLTEMRDFTDTMDRWYTQMQALPTGTLHRLIGLGDKIVGLLNIGNRKPDKR